MFSCYGKPISLQYCSTTLRMLYIPFIELKPGCKLPAETDMTCYFDVISSPDILTRIHLNLNFRFIAEESVAEGVGCDFSDAPTWIIDPIDGTTNFVHGYAKMFQNISLARDGKCY